MTEIGVALTRRRALGGVIYLFVKRSIAYQGGRIPHCLHKIKGILDGAVVSQEWMREIDINYRITLSTQETTPIGRVRFSIDWGRHALILQGSGAATIDVASETMLEDISPSLAALADFVRQKGTQVRVNDLSFIFTWLPEIAENPSRLQAIRAQLRIDAITPKEQREIDWFNLRSKVVGQEYRAHRLAEQSVSLKWMDEFIAMQGPTEG